MIRKGFLCSIAFFVFLSSCATHQNKTTEQAAGGNTFLWEIVSESTSVYLLGSMHAARKDLYPLSKTIEDAFAESAALWVEVNSLEIDNAWFNQFIAENGFYKGDKTIRDDLSEETFGLLEDYLAKNAIPAETVMKMKPSMLSITLGLIQLLKMGFSPDYGIDRYFCKKAQDRIPVFELETHEEQLRLIFEMPSRKDYIKYTIIDLQAMPAKIPAMLSFWGTGNAEAMTALLFPESLMKKEFMPILEKMVFNRNRKMAEKIKGLLGKKEKSFVVVGAAHLLGDRGLLSLMGKEGFLVKQL